MRLSQYTKNLLGSPEVRHYIQDERKEKFSPTGLIHAVTHQNTSHNQGCLTAYTEREVVALSLFELTFNGKTVN